jgi:hypothetical protein
MYGDRTMSQSFMLRLREALEASWDMRPYYGCRRRGDRAYF